MADRPEWESRTEYKPSNMRPRSASTGRLQRLYSGQPLRPTTANEFAASRDMAPPQRRVLSAFPARSSGGPPINAWVSPSDVLPESSRKVHVQALARNKRPELLAEDLVAVKEQLTRAREESMMATVEKRRLESEVSKLRASLLKSEELLHNKERMMSPTLGISQLYRSPDTTHLVANLKEQNRELRLARDSLADELMSLNRSIKATRMAEVQSELFAAQQELERVRDINKATAEKLDMAEMVAQQAVMEAEAARRTLDEYIAIGAPLDPASIKVPSNSSISGGGVRKTLQALHQAHKMLMNQAALIRAVFPTGLSMKEFQDRARQKVNTAGAPDVLNFIRNHVSKLQMELMGQPGDPSLVAARDSPSKGPKESAGAAGSSASPEKISNQAQLLEAVSGLVRKLRSMEEERFHANPEFESSTEQMADMMQLYVEEVRRLQGRGPTPPPVPPPSQPSRPSRQASVKGDSPTKADSPAQAPAAADGPSWDAAPPKEAAASEQVPAAKPTAPVPYKVYVTTSEVSGGAFDGQVYLTLQGENGASTEVKLPSDRYSFDTGEVNEFDVEAEDVGRLQSISMRMEVDGAETSGDDTWHLSSVRVQSDQANIGEGVDMTLVWDNWVQPSTKVQLFPESTKGPADYEVLVFTSDLRGAGTDGRVSIRFVGDAGASEWIDLDKPVGDADATMLFKRGATDTFEVSAADVGDLSHVMVRLLRPLGRGGREEESHSDWNLAKVEALHQGTGWKSVFYCNDWVSRKGSVAVLQEADTWLAKCKYTLEVRTSDLNGADFDGRAYVALAGYWGNTKEIRLARPGKPTHRFARGGTEVFEVMADEVGPITNVTVRVDASDDISDAWGLAEINVQCDSVWYGGQFVYGGWLSAGVPSTTIWKYRDTADYKLSILTSGEAGATFDGDVYVRLTGTYGTTDELLLCNETTVEGPVGVPKTVYNGTAPQEFTVKATNVGNLTSVQVRIEATGTTSSWLLDRIEVTSPPEKTSEEDGSTPAAAPKPCTFGHKSWVYPESSVTINKQLESVEFKVKVVTGEGYEPFDGDVYVSFTGLDGTSEEQRLVNGKPGNYVAGATAEFVVKAGDVGQLNMLNVRMESTGNQPWWSLSKVEVTHPTTQAVTYFRYNGVLNPYWGSSIQLSSQSLFEYRVEVHVAEGDPGNFEGDVFVQLLGNYTSDWIQVPAPEGGAFTSKAPATVTLKLSDLGTLYRADVKAEGRAGKAKTFRLDRVELVNVTAGADPALFPNTSKGSVGDGNIAYVSQVSMLNHSVEVLTGVGAGDFAGTAFVTLVCENGETDEVQLLQYDGEKPVFESNSSVSLRIRTYDMGKIKSIKVRCAGGRWALDRLKVYSHTGDWYTHTYFCGKTLNNSSAVLEKLETTEYTVTVSSDDVRGNGTDGTVYLTMVGEYGSSDESQLYPEDSDKAFERGSLNKMTLRTSDVGALKAVKIKLSPSGWWAPLHAGLKLGEVTVQHPSNGTLYKFPYYDWIDKADEWVELPLKESEHIFKQYRVAVVGKYSTLSEWSYDARIKIKGDAGETAVVKLLNAQSETDAATLTTTFNVGAIDVGTLSSIQFAMGADDNASQYMTISRVEVLNTDTRAYGVFPVDQYVYSWCGLSSFDKAPSDTTYNIEVTTASLTGAKGFDGSVYVIVHGDKANSDEMKLESWWSSGFEPGSRKSFYVSSINVGVISGVTVRTEHTTQPAAKWGLANMEVNNWGNSSRAICEWKKGYISAGTTVKIPKSEEEVDYEIAVVTGDIRGASTDATVEVQIGGSSGSSAWIPLTAELLLSESTGAPLLSRGATDKFALRRAPEIGDDRWLSLRLAGEDVHSSWYLSSVELLNTKTGFKSSFKCNNWISPGSDTTLQEASVVQTMVPYTVNVKTSNIRGADYEGEAWIQLQGYEGTTDWIKLVRQGYSKSSFLRDETISLTLNGCEVGYIYAVSIKIAPNDNDPNWNLEEVRVQKKDSEEECKFECGKWLDAENPVAYLSRWQDTVKYRVVAYTSASDADASATAPAAFEGKAYITLQGAWGGSNEMELVNDVTSWAPGEAQSFQIDVNNVGSLQSVMLRTVADSSGQPAKWVLDCVEVSLVESSDAPAIFKKTQLAADGITSVLVPVPLTTGAEPTTLPKDRLIKEYKVVVVTSDATDSAFDGDCFMQITGNDGTSDEIKLSNAASAATNFGVGASAEFTVKLPDFNGVRSLMIRADFTGAATNWNLSRVEVTDVATGSKTLLAYNSYLNTSYTSTSLYPQSSYTCKVSVRTKDVPGGDFNGRVYLQLSSYWDKTAELLLVSPEGVFKAGTTQDFTVKSNISYCSDVTLRIEPVDGGNTKWMVESVQLNFEESCCTQYAHNKDSVWLTKESPTTSLSAMWMSTFSLNLETSPLSDPFDGQLFLTIINNDPSSTQESNEVLLPLGDEPLRAGTKLSITTPSMANFTFNAIRIRAQPREGGSSGGNWTPGTVELSGTMFVFDGPIRVPGSGLATKLDSTEFTFTVHTADMPGNGTDGDVSIALVGAKGTTPETRLWLTNGTDLEAGKQSCTTTSVPDVGAFKELQIKLVENNGPVHSQLYVTKVEVTRTSTGMMTTFPVEAWVKAGEASVVAAQGAAEDVYVDYVFDVYSAVGSPSFDGEVQFKLEGSEGLGDTGCLTLGTGGGDGNGGLFMAGCSDSITLRAKDVGAPTRLLGNINSRGNCSSWALGRVEVANTKTGDKKVFKPNGSLYTWNWWTEVPELPTVQYQVTATTANTGARDFDGQVFVTLCGEDGSATEVQLAPSDGCFMPNNTDSFLVTVADVGRLKEVVIRVAKGPSGKPCKWSMACLNVSNQSSGMQAVFEHDGAISTDASITIERVVVRVDYQVTIRTSDVRGADTDGQVFLQLSGDQGVTEEILLSSDPESFRRGAVFEKSFNGVDVGGSRKAIVRLAPPAAGGDLHSGWHLETVEVLNMRNGMKGTYNCNAWLPLSGGSTTLEEATSVNALHEYTVSLTTSTQRDADFDGKAWITLCGWYSETSEMPLVLPGRSTASFRAGETATFTVKGIDVGYIDKVRIRMEPTASDPEWCLATVEVASSDRTLNFTFGDRLNVDKPTAETSRNAPPANFEVLVYTTDKADAGFEGEVSIQAEGLQSYYTWDQAKPLIPDPDDPAGLDFAQASCRKFKVPAFDFGVVTKLFLSFKDGLTSPWHLDKIVLRNVSADPVPEYTFVHRNWVNLGPDGRLELQREVPIVEYKLSVSTGDGADAALPEGGEVSVQLVGDQGKTAAIKLTPELLIKAPGSVTGAVALAAAVYKPFGRGASDSFMFSAADVGVISHAQLKWEPGPAAPPSSASATWFVNKLDVTNTGSGATTVLSAKSALSASSEYHLWPQSAYDFTLAVHTSDIRGAQPFDGDLYIKASNPWSSSEEIKLVNSSHDNFKPGSCSEFTFKLHDISYITNLEVRIEPTGSVKALHLDKVVMSMADGSSANIYSYQDVLQAPDKLSVSLAAVNLHDWEAVFVTNAESEPFNGKVYLTILGDQSQATETTEKLALDIQPDPNAPAGAPGKFMPGSRVVCKLKVPHLKYQVLAATIDVEFPPGEGGRGWLLDRMELSNVTCGHSALVFFVDSKFNTQKTGITISALEDVDYEVIVRTSDLPGAGTDGSAFITVYGSTGDSGEQALVSASPNMFDRAGTDTFSISCKDVGDVKKVVLRLLDSSGGGVHSQWHVASMDVVHRRTGWSTPFTFDDWVSVDSSVTRDKPGASKNVYQPHVITITTDDQEDSGFDGDVAVMLRGTGGATTYNIPLTSASSRTKAPFSAGAVSEFHVRAADVGQLQSVSVTIKQLPCSSAYSWRPKRVAVRNEETGVSGVFGSGAALLYYWDGAVELGPIEEEGQVVKKDDPPTKTTPPAQKEETPPTPTPVPETPPPPPPPPPPPATTEIKTEINADRTDEDTAGGSGVGGDDGTGTGGGSGGGSGTGAGKGAEKTGSETETKTEPEEEGDDDAGSSLVKEEETKSVPPITTGDDGGDGDGDNGDGGAGDGGDDEDAKSDKDKESTPSPAPSLPPPLSSSPPSARPSVRPVTPPHGIAPSETFTDADPDLGDSATDMFDSMSIRSASVLRG